MGVEDPHRVFRIEAREGKEKKEGQLDEKMAVRSIDALEWRKKKKKNRRVEANI